MVEVADEVVMAEHIGGQDAAVFGYRLGVVGRQIRTNDEGERIIGPIKDTMEERRKRLRKQAEDTLRKKPKAAVAAIL